jgi:Protein of unknown function (DUF1688)
LPEYRKGGLLIDGGVLQLKNPRAAKQAHQPNAEFIVEWRILAQNLRAGSPPLQIQSD